VTTGNSLVCDLSAAGRPCCCIYISFAVLSSISEMSDTSVPGDVHRSTPSALNATPSKPTLAVAAAMHPSWTGDAHDELLKF